jgi:DNA polymerase
MIPDRAKAARDILTFYVEAGVDMAVGETPNDYLAGDPMPAAPVQPAALAPAAPEPVRRALPAAPPPRFAPMPAPAAPPGADAAVMAAREAARTAKTMDELRAILEGFEGCALKATASRLVFADGNPQARVMFVGEAPGRDEDIEGLPFVGRSGKLLDRMLSAIGLDRTKVYIANIVPWRPPGNRTPTPVETQICLPFLLRQIELCAPDIVVTMGNPSTQTLLQISDGITRTRGRWFPFKSGDRDIRVMPTFHPAFLLRSPLQKRFAWRDFLAIKKALG